MSFVTKCYTPMRGCSALQSVQKMVERRLLRFIELIKSSQIQVYWLMGLETYLQDMREDVILHHCIVYPDRASPDLNTVQNKIVMLATNLLKERSQISASVPPAILNGPHKFDFSIIHSLYVLPHWCRKRMVRAAPSAFCQEFFVSVSLGEKREFGDPEEMRIFGNREFF